MLYTMWYKILKLHCLEKNVKKVWAKERQHKHFAEFRIEWNFKNSFAKRIIIGIIQIQVKGCLMKTEKGQNWYQSNHKDKL